jgi:hypothetical protein
MCLQKKRAPRAHFEQPEMWSEKDSKPIPYVVRRPAALRENDRDGARVDELDGHWTHDGNPVLPRSRGRRQAGDS